MKHLFVKVNTDNILTWRLEDDLMTEVFLHPRQTYFGFHKLTLQKTTTLVRNESIRVSVQRRNLKLASIKGFKSYILGMSDVRYIQTLPIPISDIAGQWFSCLKQSFPFILSDIPRIFP